MRVARLGVLACVSGLLVFAGCSGSSSGSGFDPNNPNGTGGNGNGGNGSGGGLGGTGGPSGGTEGGANNTDCSDAAKLVYVVSEENDLYSFQPADSTFKKIGPLDCSAGSASPNSMAVDRTGTAWVNYDDGNLFKVSTADAHCTSTSFKPKQHNFVKFGMAFSSNSAGSTDETLFVVGLDGLGSGQGLAKIDLNTMVLDLIGDFTGTLKGKGAELTGTGDGKLYGFFTTNPNATLAEIDKGSGATPMMTSLKGVNTGLAWAFSFWGGDFWYYTSDGISPSTVTRQKTSSDGSIAVSVDDVGGFRIVGAGVSTCAPTTPPTTK